MNSVSIDDEDSMHMLGLTFYIISLLLMNLT